MAITVNQSTVSVGATSTIILAQNSPGRVYAAVGNLGDVAISIAFGQAAVLNNGWTLQPGQTMHIADLDDDDEITRPWQESAIYGIVASGSATVSVVEVTR